MVMLSTLMAFLVVRSCASVGGNASVASKDCGVGSGKTVCDPCKATTSYPTTPLTMNGPEVMASPGVYYYKFTFGAPTPAAPANAPRHVTFSEAVAVTGSATMNKYNVNFKVGGCPTEKGTLILDTWGDSSVDHRATAIFAANKSSGPLEVYARLDFKDAGTCVSPNCAYKVSACGTGVSGALVKGDFNAVCLPPTTPAPTSPPSTTTTTSPFCSQYGDKDKTYYTCSAGAKMPVCCCGHKLMGSKKAKSQNFMQCLPLSWNTSEYNDCPEAPTPVAGPCGGTTAATAVAGGLRTAASALLLVFSLGAVFSVA